MISPLHDRVLLKRLDPPKQTASGIYLPDISQDTPTMVGEIIAVGPGKFDSGRFVETTVKPGQKAVYLRHAGTEVTMPDGTKLLTVMEQEIIGLLVAGDK